jgi:hypothetical protein
MSSCHCRPRGEHRRRRVALIRNFIPASQSPKCPCAARLGTHRVPIDFPCFLRLLSPVVVAGDERDPGTESSTSGKRMERRDTRRFSYSKTFTAPDFGEVKGSRLFSRSLQNLMGKHSAEISSGERRKSVQRFC